MDPLYTLADGSQVPWYEILRRAGFIPSSELWDPPDDEGLPTNPLHDTWVHPQASDIVGETLLPYQGDPQAIARILAMSPEDLPRELLTTTSKIGKVIAQARLDGSLP
jgi:hypothetical protein